jgi:hypothetical protein
MTDDRRFPRYPVYVLSKGRANNYALTIPYLERDKVPFYLVVEPQEEEAYRKILPPSGELLVLPFSNLGQGAVPARNWIRDHAESLAVARHWQLDDNMRGWRRMWKGKRIPCHGGWALRVVEDFSDRYENVALSGPNYQMFVSPTTVKSPAYLNTHVYSCTLVNHAMPYRWRGPYNDDTDICLQALAGGWCTLLVNVVMVSKLRTETMTGGMRAGGEGGRSLYDDDGRLKMARALERRWPHVVRVDRRFGRPQHVINWKKFDTPLRLRSDVNLADLERVDEYGIDLRQSRDPGERLQRIADEFGA